MRVRERERDGDAERGGLGAGCLTAASRLWAVTVLVGLFSRLKCSAHVRDEKFMKIIEGKSLATMRRLAGKTQETLPTPPTQVLSLPSVALLPVCLPGRRDESTPSPVFLIEWSAVESLRTDRIKTHRRLFARSQKQAFFTVRRSARFILRTLLGIQLNHHCHAKVVVSEIRVWHHCVYCSSASASPMEHKVISQTSEVKQM